MMILKLESNKLDEYMTSAKRIDVISQGFIEDKKIVTYNILVTCRVESSV